MRLDEFQHSPKNTPESNLTTALELIRHRYKDKKQSGLWDAIHRFQDMDNILTHEFSDTDVVRNPLITKILKK